MRIRQRLTFDQRFFPFSGVRKRSLHTVTRGISQVVGWISLLAMQLGFAATMTVTPTGIAPNLAYSPNAFSIFAGDRVIFMATADDPLHFDSDANVMCTEPCSFTFTQPGTVYRFYSATHGAPSLVGMSGTFTVQPNPDLVFVSDFDPSVVPMSLVPELSLTTRLANESGMIDGVAEPGETLTYEITLTNRGTADAVDQGITAEVPSHTTFASATNSGSFSSNSVSWNGLSVPINGSVTVSMSVVVDSSLPSDVMNLIQRAHFSAQPAPTCTIVLVTNQCVVTSTGKSPVAPAIDATLISTFPTSNAFLYSGDNPVQVGVAPSTIEARRVAVIRGNVFDRDNQPLPGVTITALNHPEFGQTGSRLDGQFDLAVNGGGYLTVQYSKAGYLPVQRTVNTPWQDFVAAPDVVMIPLDTQATTIIMNPVMGMQVAQGSQVIDQDGARHAVTLFPAGTSATMLLPDGRTQPLASLTVRATEYTVGDNGPQAMPGDLPATSGYTYAVELSVDEALVAGAKRVQFNQPVIQYVDNFLSFPIGMAVPVGYYDRDKAAWVPSDNGQVIKILSITNNLADIDINGSGTAADATALAILGITLEERSQLATLYPVGTNLWRVLIDHFTPWDFNWGVGPPPDAGPPNPPSPPEPEDPTEQDNPDGECGSIIECQNQSLGESLPIAGTPFSLNYKSSRMPGYDIRSIRIPLSGASVPASVKRIELEITVGGKTTKQTFSANPNQIATFTWDGKDVYDRLLYGSQPVSIQIGYVYPGVYLSADQRPGADYERLFGHFSYYGIPVSGDREASEVTLWKENKLTLGQWQAPAIGLGGWMLEVQHIYDPNGQVLFLGDGRTRQGQSLDKVITTSAGNGSAGFSGDGGPATAAQFDVPIAVSVDSADNLYIADSWNDRIRKVTPDGIIRTVAGAGGWWGFLFDDVPATATWLNLPNAISVDSVGNLYITDWGNSRIRKVTTDGIIHTVAGGGIGYVNYPGDDGPATAAHLSYPQNTVVDNAGNLYIADAGNNRIRKVTPDGIIHTIAGNGQSGFSGDGGLATAAQFRSPASVAVNNAGSLYIADTYNGRIRKVTPDGIIRTVAGNGQWGFAGEGIPATAAPIPEPKYVAVDNIGNFYIAHTYNGVVHKVTPDGIIHTVTGGNGQGEFSGDGGPATAAQIDHPTSIAVNSAGSLYLTDIYNSRIRKVFSLFPGIVAGDFTLASEDGAELYHFDAAGRHVSTRSSITGAERYHFTYNAQGLLTQISDGDGNVTQIQRNASGQPTAIVAPDGQITTLALDANGYLASLTNPANEKYQMIYTSDGLMTSFTNPRNFTSTFTYSPSGRLIKDENAAGGFWSFSLSGSTNNNYIVSKQSALGRTTLYQTEKFSMGDIQRTNTWPDGSVSTKVYKLDGTRETTDPDGTVTTWVEGPDPRFGMQSPLIKNKIVVLPSGLTLQATTERAVDLSDRTNLLSLTTQTDTVTVNGKTSTEVYNAATHTTTRTSPLGRTAQTVIDTQGRPIQLSVPGLAPLSYSYDNRGRLISTTQTEGQDTRSTTLNYNAQGWLGSLTDPLNHTVRYLHDPIGRITQQTLPDNRVIQVSYDANSNTETITPPSRPAHTFVYTPVNRLDIYAPPSVPGISAPETSYTWNADQQLTQVTRPDGQTISPTYDAATGQLTSVTTPQGIYSVSYLAGNRLQTVSAPGGVNHTLTWDGPLLKTHTLAGPIAGTVSYTYGNDFHLDTVTVGTVMIDYGYDDDGLLTSAIVPGNPTLNLTRNTQNGLLTDTTLGTMTDHWTYNVFADPMSYEAKTSGNSQFAQTFTRDKLGRITQKTETVLGTTHTIDNTYDLAGRLDTVAIDGTLRVDYGYDDNGNRTNLSGANAGMANGCFDGTQPFAASYDDQDRMLTYGNCSYTYTANGELTEKRQTITNQPDAVTTYSYDVLGNLRNVTLPDGTQVEYLIDGLNRRIGKKVNSTLTQGFLYLNQLEPIAELDGNGTMISTFIYADRAHVPSVMIKGGTPYRLISDHLGSVRLVIDTSTGTVVQRLDYDEWGNITTDTNPGFQPFAFAGGIYDQHTKLTRFGARDYDPETGRWTIKDPIGFKGGDTNHYAYVGNDPVNAVDPLGLMTICIDGKAKKDFSKYPGYIQVAASYIMQADSLEEAALTANSVYSGMNAEYQRTGVWTQSLENHRNAEHYMFALYWADRAPGVAQASLFFATPAYSAYKGLFGTPPKDSPASLGEVGAGYRGISDSLSLLPGGNLEFTNGKCDCD